MQETTFHAVDIESVATEDCTEVCLKETCLLSLFPSAF